MIWIQLMKTNLINYLMKHNLKKKSMKFIILHQKNIKEKTIY